MAKQPFTPAGVQAKQTELYALPDNQLTDQADVIRADLRQWTKENFILDATQITYLDGIDAEWISFSGALTGLAVQYRRPVILTIIGPIAASKLIRTPNDLVATTSATGITVDGTLTFEIEYQSS
ncbi:MAG: hypothetical protein JST70_17035 [Bacteroidetes bacterium]|nr:hypothetical protein [Bacteroidota bacterium]